MASTVRQRWLGVLGAHPAHEETDLALGELRGLVDRQQVAGLTHRSLLVTDQVRGAEVDHTLLVHPQARRRAKR